MFTLPDPSSLPAELTEEGRQQPGETRSARSIFFLCFLPFPRTFSGFAPSQGEEANRWHCDVSGGARPCWRPGTLCLNAGKGLWGTLSPCKRRCAVSPWPFVQFELLRLWLKARWKVSTCTYTLSTLSVTRKRDEKPSCKY